MDRELPSVIFHKRAPLNIEVMDFDRLLSKLTRSEDHNPFAAHKIEFYLILVVTKNAYTHFVDFKSYELRKGSILFVAKNQVHHFNKEIEAASGFGIVFNHLFVDKHYLLTDSLRLNRLFNYHIESPVVHRGEAGEDNLLELVAHLHHEYLFSDNFAKPEILAALLRVLLLKAERVKAAHSSIKVSKHWLEVFGEFRSLLEEQYINTRSSRDYAKKLLVSYKFLNDVVKTMAGKTVKSFIDDFVTVEIKRYLISTSLSVKEISFLTGFEEPANMIKFFKKHTGTTPLRFRQRL